MHSAENIVPMNNPQATYVSYITKYQSALYAYILTIHPDRNAAEDVLQETNLILWKRIDDFEMGTNFQAWAYKIAYFQTMRYLKTKKRKSWLFYNDELLDVLNEETLERFDNIMEKRDALKHCISKLKPDDAELLNIRYEHNASLAEISEITGRSEGALKQVFLRIRRTLRAGIERHLSQQS